MSNADQATVTVMVAAPIEATFRTFIQDIDQWWRHGFRFRNGARGSSRMHLDAKASGGLFEYVRDGERERPIEIGRITHWRPPHEFVMRWRNINFAEDEYTQVRFEFVEMGDKTKLVVVHSRLSSLRDDHPARHGQLGQDFVRATGMWWGDLLRTLREHAADVR